MAFSILSVHAQALAARTACGRQRYFTCALLCACVALSPHLVGLACSLAFVMLTLPDCPSPELALEPQKDLRDLARVHVAYAGEAAFFPGLLHSMLSVARHLEAPEECTMHLVLAKADVAHAENLVGCFRKELASSPSIPTVSLHELRAAPFNASSFAKANLDLNRRMANPFTFVRFYLHEYLPAAPRAIWLDMDTIVKADIAPLYRVHMRHPLAAARSTVPLWSMFWWRFHVWHARGFFTADSPTFNAGVLVLDLERWRSEGIERSLENWLKVTRGTLSDQAALILEFQGRFDLLDWRWNMYQFNPLMSKNCADEAHVLHYAGEEKPWNSKRRPYRQFFKYGPRHQCDALNWTGLQ
mmetsp:Transcript_62507/g.201603  ORF Transcript_62507/g.201603 Transcript_62507/m.201603 type:complete len:357 (+) Transcript_62507:102-1172(+)